MRKFIKILMYLVLTIILLIVVILAYVQFGWKKTYEAPFPTITASTDPVIIERGRYLAFGPAHCAVCHVPMDKVMAVDNGLEIPMSGGWEEEFPGLGIFRGPNLTPDPETGIGRLTDAEIARTIRYGVKSDGSFLPPFMEFQGMSDEDLTAVISFLRSQEAVKNEVKPTEYTFVAKALLTFGMLKPQGPETKPPISVERDSTAAYGKYLANDVANCRGCHIAINDKGVQTTPDFSGSGIFHPNAFSEGLTFVSPNITPHPTTGIMTEWDEEFFIDRFRGGRMYLGSPMPWGHYSRLDEVDMKALYRYLHSLDPVENVVERVVYGVGEKVPE